MYAQKIPIYRPHFGLKTGVVGGGWRQGEREGFKNSLKCIKVVEIFSAIRFKIRKDDVKFESFSY